MAPLTGWGGFSEGLKNSTAITGNLQQMAIQGNEEERKQAIFPAQKEAADIGLRKAQYEEREAKAKEENDNKILSATDFVKSQKLSEESQKLILDRVESQGYGIKLPTGDVGIKRRYVKDVLDSFKQDKELQLQINSNELQSTIRQIGTIEEQMKNPKAKPEELQALKAQYDKLLIKKGAGINAMYYGNEKLMQEKLKSDAIPNRQEYAEDRRDARSEENQNRITDRFNSSQENMMNRFNQAQQTKTDTRPFEVWKTTDGQNIQVRKGDKPPDGAVQMGKQSPQWDNKAGFQTLPEEDKAFWYDGFLKTGVIPPMAARDKAGRDSFTEGVTKYAKEKGIGGDEFAYNKVKMSALKSSLTFQQKQKDAARSFVENIKMQTSEVERLSNETISRVGPRFMDVPIRELNTRFVGSGDEKVYESYLMDISREISKLSQGAQASVQQLNEREKELWDKVHDVNLSPKEIIKVLHATNKMADMRFKSLNDALGQTEKEIQTFGKKDAVASSASRAKAIQELQKRGKDVNEDTIKMAIGLMGEE